MRTCYLPLLILVTVARCTPSAYEAPIAQEVAVTAPSIAPAGTSPLGTADLSRASSAGAATPEPISSTEDAPGFASPTPFPTVTTFPPSATPSTLQVTLVRPRSSQDGRFVATLFWAEDGQSLYVAIEKPPLRTTRWNQFNLADRSETTIFAPPPWTRPPTYFGNQYGVDAFKGTTSPRGRYYLASRSLHAIGEQLRLVDTKNESAETVLVSGNAHDILKGAQWTFDERLLVFAWGPAEWGRDLLLHDIQAATTTIIPTGNVYPESFRLSPDGSYVAAFDPGFGIAIISLPAFTLVQSSSPYVVATWSHNSQRVYGVVSLWDGSDYHHELRMIDTVAEMECTLLARDDFATIQDAGVYPFLFDVSPDEKHFAFWDTDGAVALVPVPDNLDTQRCHSLTQ